MDEEHRKLVVLFEHYNNLKIMSLSKINASSLNRHTLSCRRRNGSQLAVVPFPFTNL